MQLKKARDDNEELKQNFSLNDQLMVQYEETIQENTDDIDDYQKQSKKSEEEKQRLQQVIQEQHANAQKFRHKIEQMQAKIDNLNESLSTVLFIILERLVGPEQRSENQQPAVKDRGAIEDHQSQEQEDIPIRSSEDLQSEQEPAVRQIPIEHAREVHRQDPQQAIRDIREHPHSA